MRAEDILFVTLYVNRIRTLADFMDNACGADYCFFGWNYFSHVAVTMDGNAGNGYNKW